MSNEDDINLENAHLFASESRGVYIPKHFAQSAHRHMVSGVSEQDWAILEAGPDHAWYWEAWNDVLSNAVITDDNGTVYYLHQDGDLWLVPEDATNDNDDGEE